MTALEGRCSDSERSVRLSIPCDSSLICGLGRGNSLDGPDAPASLAMVIGSGEDRRAVISISRRNAILAIVGVCVLSAAIGTGLALLVQTSPAGLTGARGPRGFRGATGPEGLKGEQGTEATGERTASEEAEEAKNEAGEAKSEASEALEKSEEACEAPEASCR